MKISSVLTGIKRNDHGDLRYADVLQPLPVAVLARYWRSELEASSEPLHDLAKSGLTWFARRAAEMFLLLLGLLYSVRRRNRRDRDSYLPVSPKVVPLEKPSVAEPNSRGRDRAVVTLTSAGDRIIDKRIRPAQPQPQDVGKPSGKTSSEEPREVSPQRRGAVVRRTLWFTTLGKLIRVANRTPLPVLSDADLGRYALTNSACRRLLYDKNGSAKDMSRLFELAAEESAGDWRTTVIWWIKRHISREDIVQFVQGELTNRKEVARHDRRLILMLRLAGHVADALADSDARSVLRIAVGCARHPVNPYSSSGLTMVARTVVTTLLKQRPELDEQILRSLDLQAGSTRMEPDMPVPIEARLLAFAIRDRAPDFGNTLSELAVRAGFGVAQLKVAARLADFPLVRPARVNQIDRKFRTVATVGLFAGLALPWIMPVFLTVAAGAATHFWHWKLAPVSISLDDSIALLVALATVNVFTVQLSASRLPGIIARPAGQPWELFFSYSSGLTLLGMTVFPSRAPWLAAAESWAAIVSLVLLSGSLLAALFRLARRTDAGQAAEGYVERTLPMARLTGLRLGRIQANSVEMRQALESVPSIKFSVDVVIGEWGHVIAAGARGFFMPKKSGMRKLLAHDEFNRGMRLRIVAGLGTIVGEAKPIAFLLPAPDQVVKPHLARRADRLMRSRSCKRVERVASGAVALTQMALDLAKAGDIGTAGTVAQSVARLVAEHTAAARRARARAFRRQALRARLIGPEGRRETAQYARASTRVRDTEVVPVVPAIRDSLLVAARGRLDIREDLFNVAGAVIEPLLSSSGQADAAIMLLISAVSRDLSPASADRAVELLRIAGVRALELGDTMAFDRVMDRFDEMSKGAIEGSRVSEIVGGLAAIACRFDVTLSERAFDHALRLLPTGMSGSGSNDVSTTLRYHALLIVCRVGAAGLAARAMSVAVRAAQQMCDFGWQDSLAAFVQHRDFLVGEAFRANLYGGYLGDQAEDSIASFAKFVNDLVPVLEDGAKDASDSGE